MKNFMFSAVALVAFSFAGMANTGGEEKLNIKEIIEVEDPNWGCVGVGFAASDAVLENGGTVQQATAAAEAAYNRCLNVVQAVKVLTLLGL
jgi:hypothetical protein